SEAIEEEPHRVSGRVCSAAASRRREVSVPGSEEVPFAIRGAAGAAGAAAGCGEGIVVLHGGAERAHRPAPTRAESTGARAPGTGRIRVIRQGWRDDAEGSGPVVVDHHGGVIREPLTPMLP